MMLSRRSFCATGAAAFLATAIRGQESPKGGGNAQPPMVDVAAVDRARILRAADRYLRESPVTLTAFHATRSAGGLHDYFSEGDYWWPDPANPDGPYIQRDGLTNPGNFTDHRHALISLSVQMPALAAAWLITKDNRYARHAAEHLSAWFVSGATRMNSNLEYAQAIHGRFTGRGIGIIDTLHLVEVARAASVLENWKSLPRVVRDGSRAWFKDYLRWMTTSPHGLEERDAKNNHGTCWVLQVAEFSRYTGDEELRAFCRERFKSVLVPNQIAANGSFPLELARTKPYGYCLFNLDAMAASCRTLSTSSDNLWSFELADERGMRKAVEYMFPFIADKSKWPFAHDVEYFDQWPVRQPTLFFAGLAYSRQEYIDLWRKLDPDPTVEEIIRNFPIRQPVLWVE